MSAFVKIPLQAPDPARPACWCSCSTCSTHAADAVQPAYDARDRRRARAPAEYPALERRFDGGHRRRGQAAALERGRRGRRGRWRRDARRSAAMPRCGCPRAARCARQGGRPATSGYDDVNYVFPTFVTHPHAGRAGRPDDRRDLRRGDVGQRRRAERARHGHHHRLLPAPLRQPDAPTTHYLRVSKMATGLLGAVRLRRRHLRGGARDRSSRSSTASARSSTARCSACSCWPSVTKRATADGGVLRAHRRHGGRGAGRRLHDAASRSSGTTSSAPSSSSSSAWPSARGAPPVEADAMSLRVFVTGGTFDKAYNERDRRRSPSATRTCREMLAAGALPAATWRSAR